MTDAGIIANNNQQSINRINSDTSITTGVTIQVISFGTLSFNGGVVRSNIDVDNLGTCNIGGTAVINTYTEGVPSVQYNSRWYLQYQRHRQNRKLLRRGS